MALLFFIIGFSLLVQIMFTPKLFIPGLLFLLTFSACSFSRDVPPPPALSPTQETSPDQGATPPYPVFTQMPKPAPDRAVIIHPPQTEETGNPSPIISIKGQVLKTSGLPVGDALTVTLEGFEGMQPVLKTTAEVDAAGNFRFEDLEAVASQIYLVSTSYRGNVFTSNAIHPADVQNSEISGILITVFDTTMDIKSLVIERAHVFLDFNTPTSLEVSVLLILSNLGEEVVSPQNGTPALVFELPTSATHLQFDEESPGERFVPTAQGFMDLEPIYPGLRQHEILFAYDIPYERKQNLTLNFPVAVDSAIIALPVVSVRLQGQQVQESGQREIEGTTFQFYEANNLAAKTPLTLKLSGRVGSSGETTTSLIIGSAALVLVLASGGLWYRRRRSPSHASEEVGAQIEVNEDEDTLLDAIVALDDKFCSGELPEEAYRKRRAELKNRLKKIKNPS
jgi:hypothetical protein